MLLLINLPDFSGRQEAHSGCRILNLCKTFSDTGQSLCSISAILPKRGLRACTQLLAKGSDRLVCSFE